MNVKRLRNSVAVLVGLMSILLLSSLTDIILEQSGVFPTIEAQKKIGFHELWMNLLALAYRFVYGMVGGYITSRVTMSKSMRNVKILGLIGTSLALIGNIAASQIPEMKDVLPLWFSITLVLIAFPSVWLGGKMAQFYN